MLAGMIQPKNYDTADPQNAVIQFEKELQNVFNWLERSGVQNPSKSTVFEFFSKVESLEKQNKPHGRE